ncbi:hypothetical protein Q8A67_000518 [Cirrhinus molitorella]|uniref:Uncharacterized protein n=1 Tax=Cirrhinus molitorella TaxID=172907 RepID=A0AA88QNY3_9TELE|nr:hypothetical protein Q8A67_000518 [Cirrhinus molitorella]
MNAPIKTKDCKAKRKVLLLENTENTDCEGLFLLYPTSSLSPFQKKEYWLSMALALPPSRSSPSTPSSWRRGGSRSRSSHSSAPLLAPPPPAASGSLPRSCGGVGGGGRPGGRGGGGG